MMNIHRTNDLLRTAEQNVKNEERLEAYHNQADYYGESYRPDEIEKMLKEDEGYQSFLDSLEGVPF